MSHRRLNTLLSLLLLGTLPALAIERSTIDNLYKWNPTHVYATEADWQKSMQGIATDLDKFVAFKGTFAGPKATNAAQSLIDYNKLNESILIRLEQVDSYVGRHYDVDLGNSEWAGKEQQVNNLMVDYGQNISWVEPELLQLPRETVLGWVARHKELASYRKQYEDMYALAAHTLSAPEENILALSGNITGTPADVYSKMTNADLQFGWIKDEKGDSIKTDYSGWVSYRTSKDRRVREEYFKAVWNGYKTYATTLAALMAGNIKKDIYLTQARHYPTTLEHSLAPNFVPTSVYENLVKTTRANTAPLHKYDALRKRLLGFDHYRHWDYYVNVSAGEEQRYTWDQSVAMVADALAPLGPEYVKDIRHALDPHNGWVDAYASNGKRDGAYSASTYGVHPYMLYNFDYQKGLTLDDASTIAHEVGHSMHTWYSEKNQPFPDKDYAIFNAEVASTTNETLMAMKMLDAARKAYKSATGAEKAKAKNELVYLLEQNANACRDTYYRQVMFATWEWEAHKMGEENKPLTADSFNKLYGELLKEWHGPAAEYEELSSYSWSTIPHFYRGYYVYAYATSYAAAVALAQDIRAEANGDKTKMGAHDRYLTYLKSGSSKHPVELLKDAGVDMATPAPIEAFVHYFASLVNELDALTK